MRKSSRAAETALLEETPPGPGSPRVPGISAPASPSAPESLAAAPPSTSKPRLAAAAPIGSPARRAFPALPARADRPLRILQVTHDLAPGGLQRVVVDLARGLRALGHDAQVCSLRGEGPLLDELRDRGVPAHPMPWPARGVDRGMFLKVTRLLREGRFDVIHTHNTQGFLDGGLAALLARVPARIHTDHARPFPDKLRYMIAERVFASTYDKVVGVSEHTAENLRRYEKIPEKKLRVILNGIDGARYREARAGADIAALRRRAGLEKFSRVFGLGVRLEEQKGIAHLLAAMPEILARHPDAGLAIAGGGTLEGALKAQVRSLGIAGNVRFLGSFAHLEEFYPLLDFFVLPSLWEGLPLCLLEAMSLGLPIVATKVGGVGALLTEGRDALLVPPGDARALAQAVTRVLDDFPGALRFGAEARGLFDSRHDAARMVGAYLDLYRAALGGRP